MEYVRDRGPVADARPPPSWRLERCYEPTRALRRRRRPSSAAKPSRLRLSARGTVFDHEARHAGCPAWLHLPAPPWPADARWITPRVASRSSASCSGDRATGTRRPPAAAVHDRHGRPPPPPEALNRARKARTPTMGFPSYVVTLPMPSLLRRAGAADRPESRSRDRGCAQTRLRGGPTMRPSTGTF
jgi:hypothetical protein